MRVTFILGYCGSGKTWHANRLIREGKAVKKFDENFLSRDHPGQPEQLVHELKIANNDCVVVEGTFCEKTARDRFIPWLKDQAHGVEVKWICMEKDLEKANKNCLTPTYPKSIQTSPSG